MIKIKDILTELNDLKRWIVSFKNILSDMDVDTLKDIKEIEWQKMIWNVFYLNFNHR